MTLCIKSKVKADGETEFSAFGMLRALMKGRAHSSIKRIEKSTGRQKERIGKPK